MATSNSCLVCFQLKNKGATRYQNWFGGSAPEAFGAVFGLSVRFVCVRVWVGEALWLGLGLNRFYIYIPISVLGPSGGPLDRLGPSRLGSARLSSAIDPSRCQKGLTSGNWERPSGNWERPSVRPSLRIRRGLQKTDSFEQFTKKWAFGADETITFESMLTDGPSSPARPGSAWLGAEDAALF